MHEQDGEDESHGREPYVTNVARRSQHRHVVEPADAAELVGLQARAADQAAVDVGLRHDPGDVGGLHRAAVEDAYAVRGGVAVHLARSAPRIAAQTSWASSGVATSPVPIAQTGS